MTKTDKEAVERQIHALECAGHSPRMGTIQLIRALLARAETAEVERDQWKEAFCRTREDKAHWQDEHTKAEAEAAALADLLRVEREKVLREAAKAVEGARCNPWATNVILALIEKEPDHE